MGIDAFFDLPFHSNLKVFKNFRFPLAPLGKAASLTLIYEMARRVLEYSSIQKQLIHIVLDEVYELLRCKPSAFELFLAGSNFKYSMQPETILLYFIRKQNIPGALALISKLHF